MDRADSSISGHFNDPPMEQRALNLEPPYSLDFAGDRWRLPDLRTPWARLIRARVNHDALYQSPEFFEHLCVTDGPANLSLLTVHAANGLLAGVVPLHVVRWPLAFNVSGHVLTETNLRAIQILGSQPLIPDDPALHDSLYTTISDMFPECGAVVMPSVPTESFLWQHCRESRTLRAHFLVYPYGRRFCHTVPLPATFEEYLAKLSAKKRYNLRRQVRRLGEAVELRCIETPGDVPLLIDAISLLIRPQPQEYRRIGIEFADLADRGMLLGYVLLSDSCPRALTMGRKHERTYRLDVIAHDSSLAALSPGSTLVFMLIEDLIRRHQIEAIDFGYGAPRSPYSSTHVLVERATILLLRKTLANRLRRTAHAAFRAPITLLKRWLRPRPPERGPHVAEWATLTPCSTVTRSPVRGSV